MHSIKEVADEFDVTYDALRYYEKEGLLTKVQRDTRGRREYSEANLEELSRVTHLRNLGATVAETKRMMEIFDNAEDVSAYDEGIAFLKRLDTDLDHKIEGIKSQKNFLHKKIARITAERNKLQI
ncbi:MerR family transcriptional regulator [Companilactobacillus kimchiensis]|uniref:HTH merR-type domain-containing protein n=1 Tax=Companilactobacillus kimchiensis TaxID=993692 RepID=A0A0R2LBK8_9LACO|nr:MerR family transcriptional regulator [Companilactobacillus kimchiensis]KRN98833.1 hypothetical protein IV57_GL000745 [Companilactobacillus kimchiensis]